MNMQGLGAASNAPRAPLLPPQNPTSHNGPSKAYGDRGLGPFDRNSAEDKDMSSVGELLARIE